MLHYLQTQRHLCEKHTVNVLFPGMHGKQGLSIGQMYDLQAPPPLLAHKVPKTRGRETIQGGYCTLI